MKITHPNGSVETWSEKPRRWLYVKAPSPFGKMWSMPIENRIFGAGGNPDAKGIHRRGRKWYLRWTPGEGWSFVS